MDESKNMTPLLYVDVNLGPNHSERIVVYEGSTPNTLAREFSKKHCKLFKLHFKYHVELDRHTDEKLRELLQSQIANLVQ